MRSRMEDDTKVSAVMKSAPSVDRHEDLRETARLLVEGDVKIAPVYEGEKLYGSSPSTRSSRPSSTASTRSPSARSQPRT